MRLKVLARKNLKMSRGKLAAQSVHAALGLATVTDLNAGMGVVVLEISDKKFEEAKAEPRQSCCIIKDKGYTEVPPGTETCMGFLEDDPREETDEKETETSNTGSDENNQ